MGLESTTTISGLVSTNPVGGVDAVSEGDDHIRLLKTVLKTTFPNVNGVVSPSVAEFNYLVGVTSAIQTQLDAKLASASYTAADVLAKLIGVDGAGSGLDADLLDGQSSAYYQNSNNQNAGTLPDARFPATLPVLSGVNLTGLLKTASNLSDLANAATARTNLGVTATGGDTTYNTRANNLSDVANAATARSNLGVTATGGDAAYNLRSNNLSDVANASTARSNLGLAIGTNVPGPTGTGASGTWGISISGVAATATLAAAATVSYIPRRTSAWADGECLHTSSNQTINTSDLVAGKTFSILNISGSSITITQGAGVTLFWTADGSTGTRTLGPRGMATVRVDTGAAAYIGGNVT